MRAVAWPESVSGSAAVSPVGTVDDVIIAMEGTVVLEVLVVVDRNTVVLPLGRSAVALIRVGVNVEFVPLGEDDGMGTIGKAADEDGVSGQTVATGTWITVVGKTYEDIVAFVAEESVIEELVVLRYIEVVGRDGPAVDVDPS